MAAQSNSPQPDIKVTVDGAEFYSLIRAMKRGYRAAELGDVIISVRNCRLTVETKRGGGVFSCNNSTPIVAQLPGGRFLQLASLVTDAKASGPLTIVFRPEFGELALPHVGVKAQFQACTKS